MRRPVRAIPVLALWLLICTLTMLLGFAQKRGPSTPEERTRALQLIRTLETDPLSKEAKDARQWLTVWLIQVPDIHVKICTTFLGPVGGSKTNYAAELTTQMMFSSTAFMIENPKKAKDEHAAYLAGVEGALKAYEAIRKTQPDVQWPFLDDLIEKRNKNELGKYVRQTMKKCK